MIILLSTMQIIMTSTNVRCCLIDRRRGGCVGGAALILKLKIPPQLNSKHQTYWSLIVICGFDPNNDESVAALINVLSVIFGQYFSSINILIVVRWRFLNN